VPGFFYLGEINVGIVLLRVRGRDGLRWQRAKRCRTWAMTGFTFTKSALFSDRFEE
jgi:hypothetical protein